MLDKLLGQNYVHAIWQQRPSRHHTALNMCDLEVTYNANLGVEVRALKIG